MQAFWLRSGEPDTCNLGQVFMRVASCKLRDWETGKALPNSQFATSQFAIYYCAAAPDSDVGSIFTPGPMVEEMATRLI